ncbi:MULTISPECIES: hypothetical protein [unclassified Streptomyces]|uniref:hypothetical protein n=1 Tax=unclassified Streptomyces TaxID=2593676 RepID=UPI00130179A4|nr:hypothetical protein [Streptomyces sp. TSRI0281]
MALAEAADARSQWAGWVVGGLRLPRHGLDDDTVRVAQRHRKQQEADRPVELCLVETRLALTQEDGF